MNFFYGIFFGILGQILSFLQLQASAKFGWNDRYPYLVLLCSVPIGFFFIRSVHHFVEAFNGETFPSRLIGFAIGIVVFIAMSKLLFDENLNAKNLVCIVLSFCIVAIQIWWK
jgi:hypothetical protein